MYINIDEYEVLQNLDTSDLIEELKQRTLNIEQSNRLKKILRESNDTPKLKLPNMEAKAEYDEFLEYLRRKFLF